MSASCLRDYCRVWGAYIYVMYAPSYPNLGGAVCLVFLSLRAFVVLRSTRVLSKMQPCRAANHQPATPAARRLDRGNLQGAPQASVEGLMVPAATFDHVFVFLFVRRAPLLATVYICCGFCRQQFCGGGVSDVSEGVSLN